MISTQFSFKSHSILLAFFPKKHTFSVAVAQLSLQEKLYYPGSHVLPDILHAPTPCLETFLFRLLYGWLFSYSLGLSIQKNKIDRRANFNKTVRLIMKNEKLKIQQKHVGSGSGRSIGSGRSSGSGSSIKKKKNSDQPKPALISSFLPLP